MLAETLSASAIFRRTLPAPPSAHSMWTYLRKDPAKALPVIGASLPSPPHAHNVGDVPSARTLRGQVPWEIRCPEHILNMHIQWRVKIV